MQLRRAWVVSVALIASACGGAESSGGGSDAGGDDGSVHEAGADVSPPEDAAPDAALDVITEDRTPPADGGPTPIGMQIVKTSDLLVLYGVTTDGFAVYLDTMTNTVDAVPIAGGSVTTIATVDPYASISVIGANAYIFAKPTATMPSTSPFAVWSSAHGYHVIAQGGALSYVLAQSNDGAHVAYFDGVMGGAARAAVIGVDGSGATTLVPAVDLTDSNCQPSVAFAGATAFVGYCAPGSATDGGAGDAGSPFLKGTLEAFAGAGWTGTIVSQTAFSSTFAATPDGASLVFFDGKGLEAYSIGGGGAYVIDASGDSVVVTPDSARVVYGTRAGAMAGAFKSSTIASPMPVTLAASGLTAPFAVSPDGKWVLATSKSAMGPAGLVLSDAYLISSATPSAPTALNPTPNGTVLGDSFTTDSAWALVYENVVLSANVGTTGDLWVAQTSGGAAQMLGARVWTALAGEGSRIVFNPNFAAGSSPLGVADLSFVDRSKGMAPRTLVAKADANFFLSADRKEIVYTYSQSASSGGLWVAPVP